MIYKLLKYEYKYYVQGTEEIGVEYALIKVPKNASFTNAKNVLINKKHVTNRYEINIDSIEDLTLEY